MPFDEAESLPVADIVLKRLIREGDGPTARMKIANAPPLAARRADVLDILRTRKGEPFNAEDLRADARDLRDEFHYFASVEALVERSGERSVVVTLVCEDPVIASLVVYSLERGWWRQETPEGSYRVRAALTLGEGDPYSIERMDADLREHLFKAGEYVSVSEERRYAPEGVHVAIYLARARAIDRALLLGVETQDGETLVKDLGLGALGFAGRHAIEDTRAGLRRAYLKQGYAFVEVTSRVIVMPRELSAEALYAAYPDLSVADAAKLLDGAAAGENVLAFIVHEGPRVKVANFFFEGIEELIDLPGGVLEPGRLPTNFWPLWYAMPWTDRLDRVKRALYSSMENGPTVFSPMPDFKEEAALTDAAFIRDRLRRAGWLDARVSLSRVAYNEDRSRVELTYALEPGPLYLLTRIGLKVVTQPSPLDPAGLPVPQAVSTRDIWEALDFDGTALADGADLGFDGDFQIWGLTPPLPYDDSHFRGDPAAGTGSRGAVARIEALFGAFGYSAINTRLEPVYLDASTSIEGVDAAYRATRAGVRGVALAIEIDQGNKYRVGRIDVVGNRDTQTATILREIRIAPGEAFNIEEMRRAADRLRRRQWFDATAPQGGVVIQPSFHETLSEPGQEFYDVDLKVQVVEGKTGSVNFAFGFSPGSGVVLNLSLTKRNFDALDFPTFHGAGQELTFAIEPPVGERERFSVTFDDPYLFGYPLQGRVALSLTRQDFGPFTRGERGGKASLGYNVYRDFTLALSYENFVNKVSGIAAGAPFEIRREAGETHFAAVSLEGEYNTLNRFLFPSAGMKSSLEGLLAADQFGGNVNMWRVTGRFTQAFELARLDDQRDLALTLRAVSLLQRPFGASVRVPLAQRLFLGSIDLTRQTWLRGFQRGGVGPSANSDPIGGNFLVNATAEISWPLAPGFFWMVGFMDAGELVPDLDNFDPDGLTVSAGFGFRIQLPVFPVPFGLDFGWPVVNQPGNRKELIAFNLSFGF